MDAAAIVFFSKGYFKATMDEIALEAGISKPTVYQYFKTKDDLFFSLMIPSIEEIGRQLEKVEKRLADGKYAAGARFIQDLFQAFYRSYEFAPDTFRIVQLFQQTGLMGELDPRLSAALNEKGKYNFKLARRIVKAAIERGLIREKDIYELTDALWGTFVGLVQLEFIKTQVGSSHNHLKTNIKFVERVFTDAMSKN